MSEKVQTSLIKKKSFFKSKWTIGIFIVVLLIIGGRLLFKPKKVYQFVPVVSGPISETVSPTGSTTPEQNVSLSFGVSGVIANTYSSLGKKVNKGQILAELDTKDLLAQLHNAEAGLTLA